MRTVIVVVLLYMAFGLLFASKMRDMAEKAGDGFDVVDLLVIMLLWPIYVGRMLFGSDDTD